MKKTIAILISVFMAVSFSACSNSENESVTEPVQTAAETQSELILEDDIDKSAAELKRRRLAGYGYGMGKRSWT